MDAETRAVMSELAEQSAEKAVQRTLTALGIDHENPIEAQKDMAALREIRKAFDDPEFQKDQMHLRRWRKTMDAVEGKVTIGAIGFAIIGGLALVLAGIRFKFFGS